MLAALVQAERASDGSGVIGMAPLAHLGVAVRRNLPLLLVLSTLAGAAAWQAADRISRQAEVHFSYFISWDTRETTSGFRFDGYYALSAMDLFAKTLAEGVRQPGVIAEAAALAGLPNAPSDARKLGRLVESRPAAPQLVTVMVRAPDRATAERLARSLQQVMEQQLAAWQAGQERNALRFRVVASLPWVGVRAVSAPVAATAVFGLVFFTSLNVLILRQSLRGV